MADTQTFYFGRLVIAYTPGYSDKTKFISDALRPGITVQKNTNSWSFGEVTNLENEDATYIHGYLVKYKQESYEETLNERAGQFEQQVIEDLVEAKSNFFLHVKSGVIAYRLVSGHISQRQFTDIFKELFEKAYNNFFIDVVINSIDDDYSIFDKIREFEVINKISFKLHPSNPNMRDLWKEVDEEIKAIGASSYTEEYSTKANSSKGLNKEVIENNEEIRGKLHMADDGYGIAKVVGTINGELKTISTGDHPTTVKVIIRDKIEETLESLKLSFKKIFNRIKSLKSDE